MVDDRNNENYDLDQFDEDFNQTQCDTNSDSEGLAPGKYQVVVEKAELQRSQKGNLMLIWRMRVLGPRYAGRKYWHRNMIVSKENLKWLKHDLTIAGLDLAKLSDLAARLGELCGVRLEIQIKRRGDQENSFINKRLQGSDGDQGGAPASEDGFPF